MVTEERPPRRFVQDRLPWLVAAGGLLVYLATLNHWVRPDTVSNVSKVGGWDVAVTLHAPLLFLLTLPLRLLPASAQALMLNGLTAVAGALTLALLARSVALLPFDRTRETRLRERSEFSLLSIPWAWLPVVLAVLLCGLQLTFWEHATGFTGEMLDLLLFAYVIRCLLEFRIDRRERWLIKLAFVYGLGVANNYAMIAFFPCVLIAVVWVKAWEAVRVDFWLRLLAAGAVGLLLYLFLPIAGALSGSEPLGFLEHLRYVLRAQKIGLQSMPGYVILILSLTSLLPVLFLSIRWAANTTDTSAAGALMTTILLSSVQVVFLAGCAAVFFDVPWSARTQGLGFALLPFYYLAALSVGYFTGYFMLLSRTAKGRPWPPAPGGTGLLGAGVAAVGTLALVAAAAGLVYKNGPIIRTINGRALEQMADQMIASLPQRGAYVMADLPIDLLLLDARLHQAGGADSHVLVHSRSLEFVKYQQELARRYPQRWSVPPELARLPEPIDGRVIAGYVASLAASNQVYYLSPSFGHYFEFMRLVPRGLIYRLEVLRPESLAPPPLTLEELQPTQQFWETAAPGLGALVNTPPALRGPPYANLFFSRALNHWGVTLQRHGNAAAATRWFELARRLNPQNRAAQVNATFNESLRAGPAKAADLTTPIELPAEYGTWQELLLRDGPFDEPRWIFGTAGLFAQGGLYRQALIEYGRLVALMPTNATLRVWRDNMEIMTRLRSGDSAAAEKQALALLSQFPRESSTHDILTQIYLATGRLTNALASVMRQLEINPDDATGLLNKGALHIQLGQFPAAIPPLDRLLKLQPQSRPAMLNRAIAHLQSGTLDLAQRDYLALANEVPDSAAVYFGLGEVAYRRKDLPAALASYAKYLEFGQKGSDEYTMIAQRVEELKRGGQPK